jgi:CheY-specific phosphatase CheX
MANVGVISSMMNSGQNGVNDDIISAIKDLGNSLSGKTGDTYQINGITYDDGTNISEAIGTLVRAVRVERRR